MTDRRALRPTRPMLASLCIAAALVPGWALAVEPTAGSPEATAPAPGAEPPSPTPDLPDGFLNVVLGSKIDEVKRALPKTSELFEVEDIRDCPLAPQQKCRRIIEKVPRDRNEVYKKAEYLFNPFTMRLVLIDVDYRLDKVNYLDVRKDFESRWGPPSAATQAEVPKEAFWPAGVEHTDVWRDPPVEVRLVYRTFPSRPDEAPLGHVRFVHVDELAMLEQLGANLKQMDGPPAAAKGGPEDETASPDDEEEPARLF